MKPNPEEFEVVSTSNTVRVAQRLISKDEIKKLLSNSSKITAVVKPKATHWQMDICSRRIRSHL